jgi:hypothetical protein
MKKIMAPMAAAALLLVGCSASLRDTDPNGFEACTMLDKARDTAVSVDERLSLSIFEVGEKAAQAKTQRILDGIEKAGYPSLPSMPKYTVKDSLAQTCRDLGVPVREVTKSP